MTTPHFTIVLYRANGEDTCRGCVMATSDSACTIDETDDREEAIKIIAEAIKDDHFRDREYCNTDVTLLIDGRSEPCDSWDESKSDDFFDLQESILGEARFALAKVLIDKRNKIIEAVRKVNEDTKKEEQRLRDLATFEELKAKLGLDN